MKIICHLDACRLFFSFYTSKYIEVAILSVVDCGGGVFGGYQQHAELWRGAQPF